MCHRYAIREWPLGVIALVLFAVWVTGCNEAAVAWVQWMVGR